MMMNHKNKLNSETSRGSSTNKDEGSFFYFFQENVQISKKRKEKEKNHDKPIHLGNSKDQ